jgi:N-acetylglucosamine malate deacetylase 2
MKPAVVVPASTTIQAGTIQARTVQAAIATGLPPAESVLVVTARPGPESAALGGLLHAFSRAGARLALLCLTRGEASPVNTTCDRLETVRPWELQLAAGLLGVSSVTVADLPDGELRDCPAAELTDRVQRAIARHSPDLIVVVDPAAGDADDAHLAQAVCVGAGAAGVPVVARTMPGARAGWVVDLGQGAMPARAAQRSAAAAHASQSAMLPEVVAGVDSLGGREQLRWLLSLAMPPPQQAGPAAVPTTGPRPAVPVAP